MNLGVLVSGNGTNLQALLDAEARGELAPGHVAVVVSNVAGVHALERAARANVPAFVVAHKGKDRAAFENEVIAILDRHDVEAVVLAGFMRILTANFVERYPRAIVNTHPSLLPAFAGVDAPAQAIAHGAKLAGVTIHFVDTTLDGGPIIAQAAVPIEDGDDATSLHARIRAEEHRLLPQVVARLAAGALSCNGRIVRDAKKVRAE